MSNPDVTQVSGFAKKKALEAAGFEVEKCTNEFTQVSVWCVMDSGNVVAEDRLQGVAVTKALEALGGL